MVSDALKGAVVRYKNNVTKRELQKIEKTVCKMFELEKIDTDAMARYSINTVFGEYSFRFDYNGLKSIFGRFEDTSRIKGVSSKTYLNVNEYSGKMNYYGKGVEQFINDMKFIYKASE